MPRTIWNFSFVTVAMVHNSILSTLKCAISPSVLAANDITIFYSTSCDFWQEAQYKSKWIYLKRSLCQTMPAMEARWIYKITIGSCYRFLVPSVHAKKNFVSHLVVRLFKQGDKNRSVLQLQISKPAFHYCNNGQMQYFMWRCGWNCNKPWEHSIMSSLSKGDLSDVSESTVVRNNSSVSRILKALYTLQTRRYLSFRLSFIRLIIYVIYHSFLSVSSLVPGFWNTSSSSLVRWPHYQGTGSFLLVIDLEIGVCDPVTTGTKIGY